VATDSRQQQPDLNDMTCSGVDNMDHQHVTNNCYRLQKVLFKSVIEIAIVLDLVGY
jgi:hypothetical protein